MAMIPVEHTVRPAESVREATAIWWPLMKELGWNRSEDDADSHFQVAQNGKNWLLLIPEESGRPEGCVIALAYPNSTGWVAFFILNAAWRGQGLGRELWKELELTFRRNETTVIGLDGVQEQVETYKRRGFEDVARIPLLIRKSLQEQQFDESLDVSDSVKLEDIQNIKPEDLAKLDLEHTGLDRSKYWSTDALLTQIGSTGFVILSNGRLTGFVYVRACDHGHRFGPLYAETYAQAKQLLHKAMESRKDSGGYVAEIFGTNPDGQKVFEELGWTYADVSYHRMWLHGRVPEEQLEGGKGSRGMYAIFDACAG